MISLKDIKKIHFTGIKGVGMTALACMARDMDMEVTGSDVAEKFITDEILAKKEITDISDFSAAKIEEIKPDLLVYTVAHDGEENLEVTKARDLDIPTLSFAQAMGVFTDSKTTIAVSGVGGKTTTTAMITTILQNLNQNPSYMIGSGQVKSLAFPGAYHRNSQIFVAEADEYKSSVYDENPKFHYLDPKVIVIPNLAFDHPDVYRDEQHTLDTFKTYIEKVPSDGAIIINLDCSMCQKLIAISNPKAQVITFSIDNSKSSFQINNIKSNNGRSSFTLDNHDFNLPILGQIYISDAVAAILAVHFFNFDYSSINNAFNSFAGTKRRFEKIFENESTIIYDDYAHHPIEISNVLKILKQTYSDKEIIAIFEPHTLSRTKALLDEFAQSFPDCQQIIIANIFTSARENDDHSISSSDLVAKINKISHNAKYIAEYQDILTHLKNTNLKNKIVITIGAGNIYRIALDLKNIIQNH